MFPSEKPFCKTPFCAGLSRSSAKAAGSWNKTGCVQGNNDLWFFVMWMREWCSSTVPVRETENQRQNSVTYCTEIIYSTSTTCKKAWQKGASVDTVDIMILKTLKDKGSILDKRLWHWKTHGAIHPWFSLCQRGKGAQCCTLLLELLSLRESRFICRIFDSKTNIWLSSCFFCEDVYTSCQK